MAFPVVEATATSSETTDVTSHTVSLPAGIASGELLIVSFQPTAGTFPSSGPTDFTLLDPPGALNNGQDARIRVYTKTATGSEGSTVSVTTAAACESTHQAYRISGWGSVEGSTGATGSSTTPDCDSLTPSGGAQDYLWLGFVAHEIANAFDGGSLPTNYTNKITSVCNLAASMSFRRELNASSEDPGSFDALNGDWAATTVAVGPAGATGPAAPSGVTTTFVKFDDQTGGQHGHRVYFRLTGSGDPWTRAVLEGEAGVTKIPVAVDNGAAMAEYDIGVASYDASADVESGVVFGFSKTIHPPIPAAGSPTSQW